MYGGTISGNVESYNAGGVFASYGTFTIDGKVDISGNTRSDGSASNVYINKTVITIGNGFDTDSKIGVHAVHKCGETDVTAFADGVTPRNISDKFSAELDGQSIVNSTDNIVQLEMAHSSKKQKQKTRLAQPPETPSTGHARNAIIFSRTKMVRFRQRQTRWSSLLTTMLTIGEAGAFLNAPLSQRRVKASVPAEQEPPISKQNPFPS